MIQKLVSMKYERVTPSWESGLKMDEEGEEGVVYSIAMLIYRRANEVTSRWG